MNNETPEDYRVAYREWRAAHDRLEEAMNKFVNIEQGGEMVPFTDDDLATVAQEREAFDKLQAVMLKYQQN